MTGPDGGRQLAPQTMRAMRHPSSFQRKAVTLMMVSCAVFIAGCSSGNDRAPRVQQGLISSKYGVSASPRVAAVSHSPSQPLPKGGGSRKIGKPYKIAGRWYTPQEDPGYDRVGIASWYGRDFHGRLTANGETYDMNALTAAHKTLPLPSYAYVTNLNNNRTVLVRINDRGPYAGNRIIDLSRATAQALGTEQAGLGKVRVQYAGPAPIDGNDYHEKRFLAGQSWARPQSVAARVPQINQSRRRYADRQSQPRSSETGWDPHSYRRSLGRR